MSLVNSVHIDRFITSIFTIVICAWLWYWTAPSTEAWRVVIPL